VGCTTTDVKKTEALLTSLKQVNEATKSVNPFSFVIDAALGLTTAVVGLFAHRAVKKTILKRYEKEKNTKTQGTTIP